MRPLANPGILKELLSEAGVSNPKNNKKAYILTCPLCNKREKLYIRKTDGRFVCWYCKEKSNFQGAPEFVFHELTGKSVGELQALLYGQEQLKGSVVLDVNFTDFFDDSEEVSVLAQPLPTVEENPDFRDLDGQWGAPGRKYLESRGISLDLALKYGIRYWPSKSRIVFPVRSQGRLLGWQSRTIKPDKWIGEDGEIYSVPKALTYEGLAKDRTLMFADRIDADHAVLCEGPIDAIKADLCGGNVASLGKAVSGFQLSLLLNSGISKLYFGLDPDASDEVQRLVDKFSAHEISLYDMRPKDGRDLGAMSLEEVYELYKQAPKVNKASIFIYLKDWNEF